MSPIPWQKVARGLKRPDEFDLTPHAIARVDQAAAGVKERFADRGFPLDRPHNVYAALTVCDVLRDGILSARRVGTICPHGAEDALVVLKGLEFALALAAPDDALPPTEEGNP